jgi:tRNA(Ile)-lysidine synthase
MERDLFQTVVAYLTDQRLLEPGATVVVGVSGGPDSVVLLHLLHRLASTWDLRLHVAHLHHGLRGPDADADADFVAALAAEWGLPCTVERADVPGVARREQLAVEETARRLRYAFLARVALQVGATRIAVAHSDGPWLSKKLCANE